MEVETHLLFDARDEVTTVPALACGGEPSATAKLFRGEQRLISETSLPRLLVPGMKTDAVGRKVARSKYVNDYFTFKLRGTHQ